MSSRFCALGLLTSLFSGCNGATLRSGDAGLNDAVPDLAECPVAPPDGDGSAGCQCGGFTMPNPAGAGLPNPASYTVNADGTVTDKVSGLLWERLASRATYTQPEAVNYCLAEGVGWRLPTRLELVSLVDFTVPAPGPTINQAFAGTPSTVFWTSSPDPGDSSSALGVFFDTGYADYDDVSDSGEVRCVSSVATRPRCYASRYQVDGAVVHDMATGLTWQGGVSAEPHAWSDAKAYCSGLNGGWRLPSVAELQTIVEEGSSPSAIDLRAFPATPGAVFWTSSPVAGQPMYAWGVDFSDGVLINPDLSSPYSVRCVR